MSICCVPELLWRSCAAWESTPLLLHQVTLRCSHNFRKLPLQSTWYLGNWVGDNKVYCFVLWPLPYFCGHQAFPCCYRATCQMYVNRAKCRSFINLRLCTRVCDASWNYPWFCCCFHADSVGAGSRSSALTLAVAMHPRARVMTCIDERSLGFWAMGHARATG